MAASWETIKVDGSDMRMYLSIPDGSGPFPAVVVSQHGPGVNEFIQDIATTWPRKDTSLARRSCIIGSPRKCWPMAPPQAST